MPELIRGFPHDPEADAVIKETFLSRKPAPRSGWVALASVLFLLAASVVYWADGFGARELLPATREAVFLRGEYWRLATSMFVHADFQHFLSNGVVFGVLAFLLYGYYGLAVFPGLVLLVGALVTGISLQSYPSYTSLVGASGLVYLMAGFWLTLYLLLERRLRPAKRFIRAVGFGVIVLVPTAVEPSVSYRTHFIGIVAGAVLAAAYFSKRKASLRAAERVVYE